MLREADSKIVDLLDGICSAVGRNLGMGFNGVTNMPHWQGSFPVSVNIGNHRVRLTPRYRDSMNTAYDDLSDDARVSFNHEEGQWTVGANWSYQFIQGSSLAFTVNNMFATDPPQQSGARFDRRRREYSLQYRHVFEN